MTYLFAVLALAGFPHPGTTGSAYVIQKERYVWATPGRRIDPVFRLRARIGGRGVYGDGVRIVWVVHRRHIWVEPPPGRKLLVRLVRASISVKP